MTVRPPVHSMCIFTRNGDVKRLNGAKDNAYTAGVICAKVARYAERLYHPDRC
jgi:anaerobic selenocysteine-containing dehydrogenase